jgi:hypothetical protein
MFTLDRKHPTTIYIKCKRDSIKPTEYKYDGRRKLTSLYFAEHFNSKYHYRDEQIDYDFNPNECSTYDIFKCTAYPVKLNLDENSDLFRDYNKYSEELCPTIDLYKQLGMKMGMNLTCLLKKNIAFKLYTGYELHRSLNKSIKLLAIDGDTIEYIPSRYTKPTICLCNKLDLVKRLYKETISSQLNSIGFDESYYYDFLIPESEDTIKINVTTSLKFQEELVKQLNQHMNILFAALFDGKFVETLNNLDIDIEDLKDQLIGIFSTIVDLKLKLNTKNIL